MRSTFLVLALIISLGGSALADIKPETIRAELNKRVTADRGRISIKFLEVVEDSRCPVDATCIWAGNAKIRIAVSKGKSVPKILELNTLSEPAVQTIYGYEIKIKELYPQKGRPSNGRPEAIITVERK